tara:strand:+ start:15977 stop:16321 length:345 start_codon:yes stop_codon:yes gene_type:complete
MEKNNIEAGISIEKHKTVFFENKLKKEGIEFITEFDTSLISEKNTINIRGNKEQIDAIPFLVKKWDAELLSKSPSYNKFKPFNRFWIGFSTALFIITLINLIEGLILKIALILN